MRRSALTRQLRALSALTALALLASAGARAAVLPDDRADLLYHRYDGGGVTVDGPSVLVRKKFFDKVSVSANYYVDMVSSASIDVLSTASPYTDERTQKSLSANYIRGKTMYSAGYIDSTESDYVAKTAFFSISQDMFGDLTNVSLSFKRGQNDVFKNIKDAAGVKSRDPTFADEMATRSYSVGVSQVLTRTLLSTFAYELITDEGYLQNPYRQVRYADPASGTGFSYTPETYPKTRTSNAASVRLKYSLPWWRASVDGAYRFYSDTWGIVGHTVTLGYTHPWRDFTFDAGYRFYKQDAADFYRDLFPRRNTLNFQARDKEMATYTANTIGVGAGWEFKIGRAPWLDKGTLNLRVDQMFINYDDFRDATARGATGPIAGQEPLYKLNATVIQFYVSAFF